MKEEVKQVFFRFACFQSYFEDIFEAIGNVETEHCCRRQCDHKCLKCQGECTPTPDCVYLRCSSCGVSAKECPAFRFLKAYKIYNFVSETTVVECAQFAKREKPLKNFPHCQTLSQIFDGYIYDAVDICSSYLLKVDEIDEDTHKDHLMYLRLIHKLPIEALYVLFEKVNTRCEKMDDQDDIDDDENEDESEDEDDDEPYTLTTKDLIKDWKHADLWKLLKKKRVNKIKALFENEPYLKEKCDSSDHNLYECAARKNNLVAISLLIDNDFDLSDSLVAQVAVSNGSLNVLELLFEHNICEVNDKCKRGNTLLLVAAHSQQVEIVRFLLKQDGIDVNAKNQNEDSALHAAMSNNETAEVLEMLLERNDIDVSGVETILPWACSNNHLEVVKLLIQQHKQSVNLKSDSEKHEPIFHALDSKNFEIVKFLLQQEGINLNVNDPWYGFPLHFACRNNLVEIVELMVKVNGIDLNVVDSRGRTALHIACTEGNIAIAGILILQEGTDVNVQNDRHNTPLHLVLADHNNRKIVSMLLKNPTINVNIRNNNGECAHEMLGTRYEDFEEAMTTLKQKAEENDDS